MVWGILDVLALGGVVWSLARPGLLTLASGPGGLPGLDVGLFQQCNRTQGAASAGERFTWGGGCATSDELSDVPEWRWAAGCFGVAVLLSVGTVACMAVALRRGGGWMRRVRNGVGSRNLILLVGWVLLAAGLRRLDDACGGGRELQCSLSAKGGASHDGFGYFRYAAPWETGAPCWVLFGSITLHCVASLLVIRIRAVGGLAVGGVGLGGGKATPGQRSVYARPPLWALAETEAAERDKLEMMQHNTSLRNTSANGMPGRGTPAVVLNHSSGILPVDSAPPMAISTPSRIVRGTALDGWDDSIDFDKSWVGSTVVSPEHHC